MNARGDSVAKTGGNAIYWLSSAIGTLAVGGLLLGALLQPPWTRSGPGFPATPVASCSGDEPAYLRGSLFGAVNRTLNWAGPGLDCGGSLRPGNAGLRLYFASDKDALTIVLGLAVSAAGPAGVEVPANVTLIAGDGAQFFASTGEGRCWSRIESVAAKSGEPGRRHVAGIVYCAGALPSLRDRGSVTLGDLHYAGWVDTDGS
jgi:hypothetical protein